MKLHNAFDISKPKALYFQIPLSMHFATFRHDVQPSYISFGCVCVCVVALSIWLYYLKVNPCAITYYQQH